MGSDPLFWLVVITCLAVLGVLLFGVTVFTRGGEANKKYANKIMRWRIGLQFLAVVFILIFIAFRGGSGG